jgi:hypothetical protein
MYVHMPVPQAITDKLGEICLVLPEVSEEEAWVGRRWMVRKKNFAQVLMIANGYPPAYARVAKVSKTSAPLCLLTFGCFNPATADPRFTSKPYLLPGWWPNIVGKLIDDQTDWRQVALHIQESYCCLAPKRLSAQAGKPAQMLLCEK